MKVSKERRDEIRRQLIEAAVILFVEKGMTDTSMRDVAARAEVAPGTAYKYFPDREQLVFAFFEMTFFDARAAAVAIDDFSGFRFKEKLQAFLELWLSEYTKAREFVALAMRGLVDSPLQSMGAMRPLKEHVALLVREFIDAAEATGEVGHTEYRHFLANLFWDYSVLVVLYWIKDDSEGFSKTSEFIDKSLDLYVTLVQSGMVDKAARLFGFFLKNHLYDNLDQLVHVVSGLGQLSRDVIGKRP
jgi:AcrR family transcriptional regulator